MNQRDQGEYDASLAGIQFLAPLMAANLTPDQRLAILRARLKQQPAITPFGPQQPNPANQGSTAIRG